MCSSKKCETESNPIYFYNVVFTDGSYLVLNTEAKDEKDIFKSTLKIEESTFYNNKLIGDVERIIDDYNGYLYVQNNVFVREFKEVKNIEKYELNKVNMNSSIKTKEGL